jgi:sulfide:quinone oxidoreductase
MRELPGDVFVGGQLDIVTLTALAEQGVMSFINNRPDNEGHLQPSSDSLAKAAAELGVDYRHIPMAGGLTSHMLDASVKAYANMPRPIMAFCASGMRSAALWAFAHVDKLGVDDVMKAISQAGYNLEQIRAPLAQFEDAQAKES